MRSMHFKMWLLVSFLAIGISSIAQNKEFEDVLKVELKNTVVIKNNKTVVGYAIFYRLEKMKKAALYRLEILDENLKSIGSNEFEGSKDLQLLDAVYESEHILLAFKDPKKEEGAERYVKVFDLKGKQNGLVLYEPEKGKKGMFGAAAADQMESLYNGYNNVDGLGFVNVFQKELKTGGADVQLISSEGKLKWEKNFTAESGDRMDMYLTATTPNALLFFVGERESIMKKESKNYIMGLDPVTGKQLFKKSLETNGFAWEPQYFKQDASGKLYMISIISDENDKFYTARPVGFNLATINDKTGEIKLEKNFVYEADLSSVIDMKSSTKTEEGYMQIHDIDIMADGSKVVVGEFFRRTVSAGGTALKVLQAAAGGYSSGTSAAQITIGDAFLLRLDKNNKPVSLEKIEKKVTRRPTPGDGLSLGLVQRYMKQIGAFGYIYTDENPDNNSKTVLIEGSFEGERYGTNAVTFDEKKGFKVKKLTVDTKGRDQVRIFKAKPGHVMVSKYSAKEKEDQPQS